ncbi:zinc ribbon domain-containing protein [Tepidimicrobium xylanilyticum]|uniref:Predicted nucleic acid-binding protein, contains Zn-ribbon domain n=1 Tax=Tepidimicrobium xylanilyticum TaxID=1123352 RepID=A0A1H2T0E8_9FIRM|nr:C4-type zinc ribbon domain-containing protein [Tepidimicrobium xylanilyticum]GMG96061.1 DNA-binding protein [Tepidimicrobium xylanilyticum]SDW37175.1 Predicted nucleic acid-binding protein, contains Zn-ribbon domain [Tepidimicrobium xylanilyticum]
MDDIEDLWELQKNKSLLADIKKKLKEIQNGEDIKLLAIELDRKETDIIELETSIKENERKLNKENQILRNLDFKLKEVEKSLFDGSIKDLKQLTFLNEEREKIKALIEEKELEMINMMEDIDEFKSKLVNLKEDFNNLKKEYKSLVKDYKSIIEELNGKAIDVRKRIESISSNMDENLILEFNKLIKTRGIAVVKVIDNRCGGCNVVLPAITVDRLKHSNSVLHCEYCDRILYLEKE